MKLFAVRWALVAVAACLAGSMSGSASASMSGTVDHAEQILAFANNRMASIEAQDDEVPSFNGGPSDGAAASVNGRASRDSTSVSGKSRKDTTASVHGRSSRDSTAAANGRSSKDSTAAVNVKLSADSSASASLQSVNVADDGGDRQKRTILNLLGSSSNSNSAGGGGAGGGLGGGGGLLGGGLLGGGGGGGGGAGGAGKGLLGSLLSSSSSNSNPQQTSSDYPYPASGVPASKGPTYSNYIGAPGPIPTSYDQKSFDLGSFRSSLMGVLLQAVRAITGGVIALKGQLIRVKGRLVSAKGNIISASGEAISQFGRNVAANALKNNPPPAPPPAPIALPPRPVYGVPMPIMPPRPVYGVPFQMPPMAPGHAVSFYSNSFHDGPPPPPPPSPLQQLYNAPTPATLAFSSHSISSGFNNYGPPPPPPGPAHNSYLPPSSSSGSMSLSGSYGPPPPPGPPDSYGPPVDLTYQAESYQKRNTNSGPSPLNSLQGAHAGLLILKPAQPAKEQLSQATPQISYHVPPPSSPSSQNQQWQQQLQPLSQSSQPESAAPEYGSRVGSSNNAASSQSTANDRTFSLLKNLLKGPQPLRPHPVTRALPPQVVAAASAQLAAQLDLAGRAPPRTAVAVSGPAGKFIMYQ